MIKRTWLLILDGFFEFFRLLEDQIERCEWLCFFQEALRSVDVGFPFGDQPLSCRIGEQDGFWIALTDLKVVFLEDFFVEDKHDKTVSHGLSELLDEIKNEGRCVADGRVHQAAEDVQVCGLQGALCQGGQKDVSIGQTGVDRVGRRATDASVEIHLQGTEDFDEGLEVSSADKAFQSPDGVDGGLGIQSFGDLKDFGSRLFEF